ncbi:carboxypeptidase M32 [Rhodobacterales bacterium HKCCE3408]|nr:carboxypeptidase M32 [Rhodobacterales bacterium HKCCE3408]
MTAIQELFAFDAATSALDQVMGRLHWDQETMMPEGAADQRAHEVAALEELLHTRRQDARIGDWLEAAEPRDETDAARLRLLRRDYLRAVRVPADLAAELARTASRGHGIWAKARAADDPAPFLPVLGHMLQLKRDMAQAIDPEADPYDVLIEDYEPGLTGAEIAELFDGMRPRLRALRDAVLGHEGKAPALAGRFTPEAQLALTREVARRFGYDFDRGRIDLAVHPFSSGSGSDVRITTRIDEADPFGCLYSTIHEVGHAAYEQHVSDALALTRLGQGVSMGVHESQSRIFENQLGRSRAFCGWLHGEMVRAFDLTAPADADAFYAAVNRVEPGSIRTESDEVQYNLHIMLRFDLERAMIRGELDVADIEEAWNARFEADFGHRVDRASNGMLQDVHWSAGLFGYFPTYSLGNVYAGCLHAALRADLPDLDDHLAQGDPSPATEWLADRVQRHGSVPEPRAVIEQATGAPVSEAPLLDYLEAKFGALYGL